MQSMVRQLEYYRLNALLILFIFLAHEEYFSVFGITVNPLDSLHTASTEEFVGSAEFHEFNNIDYSEFIGDNGGGGPTDFTKSSEAVSNFRTGEKNKAN